MSLEWMDRIECANLTDFTEWPEQDQQQVCGRCPVNVECNLHMAVRYVPPVSPRPNGRGPRIGRIPDSTLVRPKAGAA